MRYDGPALIIDITHEENMACFERIAAEQRRINGPVVSKLIEAAAEADDRGVTSEEAEVRGELETKR